VLLGTTAASIGVILRKYNFIIQRVGGLIILVLGLEFAGILNLPFLAGTKQFKLPAWTNKLGNFRAFLVGVVFAFAWTPCVGAVLGSILTLAAVSGTAVKGALLLFIYSLGISIPFIVVTFTISSATKYLPVIRRRIEIIARISGIILALLGLLLLTNTYKFLNSFLFDIAFKLGYEIK
jgi:cytochrome c-type biogenesis protein